LQGFDASGIGTLQFYFQDSVESPVMIPSSLGGGYATEEAQDDGIGRSVPGQAGPDHQYEARAGATYACDEDRQIDACARVRRAL
jgi:hypothetical protein